jgi:hypothetical protein
VWKRKIYWNQTTGLSLFFGFRVKWLGWKWVVGFIGGAKPWGRERISGLWLSVTTRWNRPTCLASWVTGSFWDVLQAKKQSEKKWGSWANSHKSGGLVSVLPSESSAHPKNPRDLTRTTQSNNVLANALACSSLRTSYTDCAFFLLMSEL